MFFVVALTIYGSINYYIFRRGWQATRGWGWLRVALLILFIFLAVSFILGRLFARSRTAAAEILVYAGAYYLALMTFLLVLTAVVDLLRLGNAFLRFFPKAIREEPQRAASVAFIAVLAVALGLVIGGYFNARSIRLRTLDLAVDKPGGKFETLTIALASDIHLGLMVGPGRLEKIVAQINGLEPDLVLLPGDIVDEDVSTEMEERMTAVLRTIRAPLGVYSVTGNHEYYAGLETSLAYLRRGNVRVLEDEAVRVEDSFYLVGRNDMTAGRMGEKRKSLEEILASADRRLPLILMDHQPLDLGLTEAQGIDLQLSGHTHNGQIFPLNLINKLIYELNWGYKRKGKTQVYVSSGAGTWGPPVRVCSVPEIVLLRLKFRAPGKTADPPPRSG